MTYEINVVNHPEEVEFVARLHGGSDNRSPEKYLIFVDTINHLSRRARKIIQIIFSSPPPPELVRLTKAGRGLNKTAIINYLYYVMGWKEHTIRTAMKELAQLINDKGE